MRITAQVDNVIDGHKVRVSTNGVERSISIPPKDNGMGSSVNGGELLFLALATCYCNDIYREAAKRNIKVNGVTVTVEGEFGGEGDPAKSIAYTARVDADATDEQIRELLKHTDSVAEIQNTVRAGVPVRLQID